MDFSKVKNMGSEGIWYDIVGPNGEETDVKFKILGRDSEAYRKKQREQADRRFNQRKLKIVAADLDSEGLNLLSVCVVEWQGVKDGDEDIPCNEVTVKKLLSENLWLKEQLDEAISDHGNFTKLSGKP